MAQTLKEKYDEFVKKVDKGYKSMEKGTVGSYTQMQDSIVSSAKRFNDSMISKLFSREGETVDETKKRLKGMTK